MNPARMRKYNRAKHKPQAAMVRIQGKIFRCACGANVFTRRGNLYQCHGCPRQYEGS